MCLMLATASFFCLCFFFFNDTATTEIYTLSLHDALPISRAVADVVDVRGGGERAHDRADRTAAQARERRGRGGDAHGPPVGAVDPVGLESDLTHARGAQVVGDVLGGLALAWAGRAAVGDLREARDPLAQLVL